MKKLFLFAAAFFVVATLFGQVPASFKYQAVLRDIRGNLKSNTAANIGIDILQGNAAGTIAYSETHAVVTDAFGLISLEIGNGNPTQGLLSAINWGAGNYFVRILVDGVNMGTAQLLSVPYALHAKTAERLSEVLQEKDPLFSVWNKSSGIIISGSQVSDLPTNITNNPSMLENNLKRSYPAADSAKLATLYSGVDLTSRVTGVLPLANGGTGSATKNFIDLSTDQTVAGNKTFTGNTSLKGALALSGNASIIGNLTVTGVTTFASAPVLPGAVASQALFTDAGKNIISNPVTGSGNVVMSISPILTGTPSAPTAAAGANTSQIATTSFVAAAVNSATQKILNTKEDLSNKSTSITLGTSDELYPTQNAVKTYVNAQITSGVISDASSLVKGKVQLAGDLTGTAAAPTVANAAITTTKLADLNVTTAKIADAAITGAKLADLNVTTAKIADAAITGAKLADANVTNVKLDKSNIPLSGFGTATADVALGAKNLTGVADPVLAQDAATKNYVDLSASSVSTAQATEITNRTNADVTLTTNLAFEATRAAAAEATKENGANKSSDGTLASNSDIKFPTEKATKTYVDDHITSGATPDATTVSKGKVQLAGDLTGTAAAPMVANAAITSAKIADDAITTSKILDGNISSAKLADLSVTNAKLSGSIDLASKVTGTLPVANGGTGSVIQNFVDLSTNQTIAGNKTLSGNTILGGTLDVTGNTSLEGTLGVTGNTTLVGNLAVTGVTTLTEAPLLSSTTASQALYTDANKKIISNPTTGSGNSVMSYAPTLVTPDLGTPSALVGTNITGTAAGLTAGNVTTNANLTGDVTSIGNATTLSNTAVTAATYGSATSVPIVSVDAKGRITGVTNTPITGTSPVGSSLTSGKILIGDASNLVAAVTPTGDVTITNAGGTEIGAGKVTNSMLTGSIDLTTKITGTLPVANGGTGVTTATGTGNTVLSASPALTGTPSLPTGTTGVTQTAGNNTTALATTAFVTTALTGAVRDVTDEFTATASQTSFTLTQTKSDNSKVKMFINGIRISNTAYSVTGTTLTYVPANNGSYSLSVGDRVQLDYYY